MSFECPLCESGTFCEVHDIRDPHSPHTETGTMLGAYYSHNCRGLVLEPRPTYVLRLTGEQIGSIDPPPDGDWFTDWDEYEDFVPRRMYDEAAAGVRVTGDAGLREAARLALAAFDAENVAALGTDQDAAEEAALDTVDAMEVLRAALTASDVEAHPVGQTLLRMGNRIADLVKERDALLAQAAAADTAAPPHEDRSDCWCNPTVGWPGHPLGLVHRNPQALSTLESRPCTTCGGYHFDRGANGRIDATCPVRAALTGDTPEADRG